MICNECAHLTCASGEAVEAALRTGHHPNCRHYPIDSKSQQLIKALLAGMREWGGMEDGIPECAADAYDEAAVAVGESILRPEGQQR